MLRNAEPTQLLPVPVEPPPSRYPPSGSEAFSPWTTPRRVRLLLGFNVILGAAYLGWWLQPGHVGTPVLFALLAVAEAFTGLHAVALWWTLRSSRISPPPPVRTTRSVDVLIPTYGEPLSLLATTVRAALSMDVPHRTVVLDDACRPEVAQLAADMGAEYIPRRERGGAKAGNLNHGLARTSGDLVVVFDADHAPRPDFLSRQLGYFENSSVGFVQSPQLYVNGADNPVARGAYQQQAIFYGPICRGKNGLDAVFCCGTNVIFQRKALEDAGGFDEDSIVEDFVTSMKIHRKGWRSVYYPYAVADGLGPTTLRDYFSQQFRWARGSVGALMTGEPFKRGFTWGQRVQYLLATSFYLIGLATSIYLMLPILYLLFGWSAFSSRSGSFLFFYAPYFLANLLTIRWGLGRQLRLEHLQFTFGTFPVYALASLAAFVGANTSFKVTGKSSEGRPRPPLLAGVTVFLAVLTLVSIVVGVLLRPVNAAIATNLSWGVVNLLLLSGVLRIALREALGRRGRHAAGRERAMRGRLLEEKLLLPELALPALPDRSAGEVKVRRPWRYVGALTAIGLVLRIAFMRAQSIRLDETSSLRQARLPVSDLYRYLAEHNVHVPLYHTLLHFWIRLFGDSEVALRAPSVLLGAAAIPLMFLVTRRLLGTFPAVTAAAAAAAAPFWLWHSDEARMYPLLLVTGLASLVLLFHAADRGGTWRWAAYALVTALSFYAHYYALLMPVVHAGWLVLQGRPRRRLLVWLAALTGAVLLFAPWLAALYLLRIHAAGAVAFDNGGASSTAGVGFVGLLYAVPMVFLFGYQAQSVLATIAVSLLGLWPLLTLAAVTQRHRSQRSTRSIWFLVWWLALFVLGVFGLDRYHPGVWYQRYLILASVPLLILVAALVARAVRHPIAACAVVLLPLLAAGVTSNVDRRGIAREDFRGAAAVLNPAVQAGDAVVVLPDFDGAPLEYYLTRDDAVVRVGYRQTNIIEKELPALAREHAGASLWVVLGPYNSFDPQSQVQRYLDATYAHNTVARLGPSLTVERYQLP